MFQEPTRRTHWRFTPELVQRVGAASAGLPSAPELKLRHLTGYVIYPSIRACNPSVYQGMQSIRLSGHVIYPSISACNISVYQGMLSIRLSGHVIYPSITACNLSVYQGM